MSMVSALVSASATTAMSRAAGLARHWLDLRGSRSTLFSRGPFQPSLIPTGLAGLELHQVQGSMAFHVLLH